MLRDKIVPKRTRNGSITMSKQEFLGKLRNALNGRMAVPQVEDTINYYEDYINVEMRKGKSEEEVLESLGDPRLIARTIVQTNGTTDSVYDAPSGSYHGSGHRGRQESDYQKEQYQDAYNGYSGTRRSFRLPGWLLAIVVILIAFFVISIIFSVLSFLAPVIIVLAAVLFLVKLFRDWLN